MKLVKKLAHICASTRITVKAQSLESKGQSLESDGQSLGSEGQSLDVKAQSFVCLGQSFGSKVQSLGDMGQSRSNLRNTFQGIIHSGLMIPFLSTEQNNGARTGLAANKIRAL